ncbi:MAG: zf-HC2 domain-containing protein [Lachnospiraceae bacterium]|nr:zf-HC2 domain-containing protein [Lachnospiraceae bacterium]
MMDRIDCEVVQDLFPSYIDGLTCQRTNEVIEEHIAGCEKCRQVLSSMRGSSEEAMSISPEDKEEIDFLKKNKKRNRRILIGSLAGAFLLFLLVIALRAFVIGTENDPNWTAINLRVADKELEFIAVPAGSADSIASLEFTEEDGVVTVQARSVLSIPYFRATPKGSYRASETIKEVRIGNRIIWSEGATVSALASELFATKHS